MSAWEKMSAPNMGLLFYKRIYRENDLINTLKLKGTELVFDVDEKNFTFQKFYNDLYNKDIKSYVFQGEGRGNSYFSLFTTYPGLLTGSGYTHDTKSMGDIKMGFFFDHTTGLPVIPGSSVKGVLHSLFESDVSEDGKNYTGQTSTGVIQYMLQHIANENKNLSEEIKQNLVEVAATLTPVSLRSAKNEIFGSEENPGTDIFFDAIIDKATSKGKFVGEDYLTPHYPDLLKDPKPLQFLKVLPNTSFKFEFKLSDFGFTKEVKELLFKQIVLTIGLGAKTNIGYGQFSEIKLSGNTITQYQLSPEVLQEKNTQNKGRSDAKNDDDLLEDSFLNKYKTSAQQAFHVKIPPDAPVEGSLKLNDVIEVVVIYNAGENETNITIALMVQEASIITISKPDKYADYTAGQRFMLIIKDIKDKKVKGGKQQKN